MTTTYEQQKTGEWNTLSRHDLQSQHEKSHLTAK